MYARLTRDDAPRMAYHQYHYTRALASSNSGPCTPLPRPIFFQTLWFSRVLNSLYFFWHSFQVKHLVSLETGAARDLKLEALALKLAPRPSLVVKH